MKLWYLLREQWVITLALAPLSLLLFGQLSVVGLVANLLAIPWVTLLLTPLALLGVVLPMVWGLAAQATELLWWWLSALAAWPGATVAWPLPPLGWGLLAVGGGLLGVLLAQAAVERETPHVLAGAIRRHHPTVLQG